MHRLWRLLLKQSPSDPLESSCDALVTWRFEHQPIDLRTGVFTNGLLVEQAQAIAQPVIAPVLGGPDAEPRRPTQPAVTPWYFVRS